MGQHLQADDTEDYANNIEAENVRNAQRYAEEDAEHASPSQLLLAIPP